MPGRTTLNTPLVTFILATQNRRRILLNTLEQILRCGIERDAFDVIVVDNASTDRTPAEVSERFSRVHLVALSRNRGSCAKGLAVDRVRTPYIVFLDDDSYPRPGSVERMLEHFESDERLGAAGFLVHLPDKTQECSAFENVFVGCGVGLRTSALRAVGGLDVGFFMQAEEYDLSFRLVRAGWRVRTFADLHVEHLKTPQARCSARTTYYDTRNNLLLADRYLPAPFRGVYRQDWRQRYGLLAAINGHQRSFRRAVIASALPGMLDRWRYARHRLMPEAFETLFKLEYVRTRMAQLHRDGVRRVLFADLGKNVYAFFRGAMESGLSVSAVADDRFAHRGYRYRGLELVPCARIEELAPEAVIISNTSPVHATATYNRLSRQIETPIHRWFDIPQSDEDKSWSCESVDDSLTAEFRLATGA